MGPVVNYAPHFWGGWVGFIGYEAGTWFEALPLTKKPDNNLPDLLFMEVEKLFLYDHVAENFKFILSPKTDVSGSRYDELKSEIINVWNNIDKIIKINDSHDVKSTFFWLVSFNIGI